MISAISVETQNRILMPSFHTLCSILECYSQHLKCSMVNRSTCPRLGLLLYLQEQQSSVLRTSSAGRNRESKGTARRTRRSFEVEHTSRSRNRDRKTGRNRGIPAVSPSCDQHCDCRIRRTTRRCALGRLGSGCETDTTGARDASSGARRDLLGNEGNVLATFELSARARLRASGMEWLVA